MALHTQAYQMAETMRTIEEGFQRLLKATIKDHKQVLQDKQEWHRQLQNEHKSSLVDFNLHH